MKDLMIFQICLHLISRMVSTSRKKLWIKAKGLLSNQKPFLPARMKDSLRNTISVDQKTDSIWISVWKIKENSFN